jgi:hypothetical protein
MGLPGKESYCRHQGAFMWPCFLVFTLFYVGRGKRDSQKLLLTLITLGVQPETCTKRVKLSSFSVQCIALCQIFYMYGNLKATGRQDPTCSCFSHTSTLSPSLKYCHRCIFLWDICGFVASRNSLHNWSVTPCWSFWLLWLTHWWITAIGEPPFSGLQHRTGQVEWWVRMGDPQTHLSFHCGSLTSGLLEIQLLHLPMPMLDRGWPDIFVLMSWMTRMT